MADITKRFNRRAQEHLAEHTNGEEAEVAILCEVRGTLGLGAVPTALLPRTMMGVSESRAADRQADAGGFAELFPSESSAVALTKHWFVALPSNGIRFDAPGLIIERFRVAAELKGQRGLGRRLAFTFSDGSQVEVDVGLVQPTKRLVSMLSSGVE